MRSATTHKAGARSSRPRVDRQDRPRSSRVWSGCGASATPTRIHRQRPACSIARDFDDPGLHDAEPRPQRARERLDRVAAPFSTVHEQLAADARHLPASHRLSPRLVQDAHCIRQVQVHARQDNVRPDLHRHAHHAHTHAAIPASTASATPRTGPRSGARRLRRARAVSAASSSTTPIPPPPRPPPAYTHDTARAAAHARKSPGAEAHTATSAASPRTRVQHFPRGAPTRARTAARLDAAPHHSPPEAARKNARARIRAASACHVIADCRPPHTTTRAHKRHRGHIHNALHALALPPARWIHSCASTAAPRDTRTGGSSARFTPASLHTSRYITRALHGPGRRRRPRRPLSRTSTSDPRRTSGPPQRATAGTRSLAGGGEGVRYLWGMD
ncbi:hypothetical protein DFH09DRAFT_1309800 [Mycena vulgaris]|nr:hypothetical protein DFH09DRAFT_1309800 [Mycena vulgaris]